MGDSLKAVAGTLVVLLVAGCSTVGDLGRPKPVSAFLPVRSSTSFNETDDERALRDRVYRFPRPPHAGGFFGTRRNDATGYYVRLKGTDYRSSHTRFRAMADDVQSDLDTIPATFEAICAVREIDRRRDVALEGLGGLDQETIDGVEQRRSANETTIAEFTAALGFRFDSYDYALDRLLVEAPHEEAREADARLNELALYVQQAEGDSFCGSAVTLGPPIDLELGQVPMLPQTSSDKAAS